MNDEIIESISFQRGYDKGFADDQEYLSKKFDKILLKVKTENYDKGYKDGANKKDNKPCVCGFWGDK